MKAIRAWIRSVTASAIKSNRAWTMGGAALAVIAWYWQTDPDGGLETTDRLQRLAWLLAGTPLIVYWLRRTFAEAVRGKDLAEHVRNGNVAAGIALAGLYIMTGLLFLGVAGYARADIPPAAAAPYLPVLKAEQLAHWPGHPSPSVLGALVEQETCPSLTSKTCWNTRAELKTDREYGFGLGQKTVAYRADGSERFNAWRETRAAHANELSGWTWGNRYDARLQLRALVLDNRECYRRIAKLVPESEAVLALCDSAYNGGNAGVLADRRLCAAKAGCDPDRWFGHVELTSTKSRVKWRGYGASAYDINRTHVRNVLIVRRPRYLALEHDHA